jgi:hypothetical protein
LKNEGPWCNRDLAIRYQCGVTAQNGSESRLDDVFVEGNHGAVLTSKVHSDDVRLETLRAGHFLRNDLIFIVIPLDQLIARSESPCVSGAFRIKAPAHSETGGGAHDALPLQPIHGLELRTATVRAYVRILLSESAVRGPATGEEGALLRRGCQEEGVVLHMRDKRARRQYQ